MSGKSTQHSKGGFASFDEAQRHLTAKLGEVNARTYHRDERITVSQLLEQHWLPSKRLENRSPTTLAQYADAAKWISRRIGGIRVESLSEGIVADMVDKLRTERTERHAKNGSIRYGKAGLGDRSVQLAVGTLKAATAWGARNRKIAFDPLANVQRPGVASKPVKAWTKDQARAFLASIADDRLLSGWTLMLSRGLRRGELAGLKWSAIDLDSGTLRIEQTRVVLKGVVMISAPKAGSDRLIPLDSHLVDLLRTHRQRQLDEATIAADAYLEEGYVMADTLGRAMHPDSLSRRFDQLVAKAGLPRLTPHGLRHTCATLLLASGVPTKVVADLLGDTVEVILNYYAASVPGMAREAGQRLSEALLDFS